MGLFTRFSNGWEIAKTSLKVLNANKQLIIFPILSGISLALVSGSFLGAIFGWAGWSIGNVEDLSTGMFYLVVFMYYNVNYFIIVFFNMALMHCAKLYFDGEEVSVAKGLQFSASRIHKIFLWAVFAATIGTVLRIIQDNLGWFGKILTGVIGIVWGVATFFVIPILAYENVGPADALKRSANLMKEKWGESIGANFSVGLVGFCAMIIIAIIGMGISQVVDEAVGILFMVAGGLFLLTIGSAVSAILVSAIYNNINGNLNEHFNKKLLDNLFTGK